MDLILSAAALLVFLSAAAGARRVATNLRHEFRRGWVPGAPIEDFTMP